MRQFVRALRQDCKAVRQALSSDWSNGQVEGKVNRLKTNKRQMYGRAGFELLRRRVVASEWGFPIFNKSDEEPLLLAFNILSVATKRKPKWALFLLVFFCPPIGQVFNL
jgi:hypothetical protein